MMRFMTWILVGVHTEYFANGINLKRNTTRIERRIGYFICQQSQTKNCLLAAGNYNADALYYLTLEHDL